MRHWNKAASAADLDQLMADWQVPVTMPRRTPAQCELCGRHLDWESGQFLVDVEDGDPMVVAELCLMADKAHEEVIDGLRPVVLISSKGVKRCR